MIFNSSLLVEDSFEYVEEAHIVIENNLIASYEYGYASDGIDAKKYLIMPAFVNSHTHIGDSFAKEAVLGLSCKEAVGKNGKKWLLYQEVNRNTVIESMRDTLDYMINSGISTFVDFRENGLDGINMLKEAAYGSPIRFIVLGRDVDIDKCDGLGLNVYQLDQILESKKNKLIAIHAGEAKDEIGIALDHNPDIIVHFTLATDEEIKKAKEKNISIVICPRSNSVLRVGIPNVRKMLDFGLDVALGTDNVMINQPNLFREMEFISKLSYLSENLEPIEILKMVTLNGAKMLNMNSGIIETNKVADLLFIDKEATNLKDNKDMVATIVHRCELENVRKVMIDGKIVVDKDIL